MKKLTQILILTCNKATYYSSIKNFKRLGLISRIQLKFHLLICTACHEFNQQSQIIDESMVDLFKNSKLQSEENLTEEKKSEIKSVVNQHIDYNK